ncbi:MAG: hypothetical protein ACK5NK_09065 [Niabella sp.]
MNKNIKMLLFAFAFSSLLVLSSCYKENALTAVEISETYPMTQGNNDADLFRYNFFTKYQTKILFDFAGREYWYAMNNTTTLKDSIDYFSFITDVSQQIKAVEFLNAQWLLFYPESFKQQNLPKYILLTNRLYDYSSAIPTSSIDSTLSFKTNAFSSLLITGLGNRFSTMTNAQKTTLRNDIHFSFIYSWLYARNKEFIPTEFFAVSNAKYGVSPRDSTSTVYNDYLQNGFLPPVSATYPNYNTKTRYQTEDADLYQFLWMIINKDDTFVNAVINNTNAAKVKQKYLILVNYFNSLGIDIRSINTHNISTLGPLTTY